MSEGKIAQYMADKLGAEFSALKARKAVSSRDERAISIEFAFPRFFSEEEKEELQAGLKQLLPPFFKIVQFSVKKDYVDAEIAEQEVLDFLETHFAAGRGKLTRQNLDIDLADPAQIIITADPYTERMLREQRIASGLQTHLNNRHCRVFQVTTRALDSAVDVAGILEETQRKNQKLQELFVEKPESYIAVSDRKELVGKGFEDNARLIGEILSPADTAVIAGKVKYLNCRTSAAGKTFYTFETEDFSGSIKCKYFLRENAEDKVADGMPDGAEVILRGSLKENNFSHELEFIARGIMLCTLPQDYVKPPITSKPVPEEYVTVFPERMQVGDQVPLFGGEEHLRQAEFFSKNRVVVFDLETTGLDPNACAITELGAVSIENGMIAESFASLVNPETFIPEEITRLTGISEDMVKDAPTIDKVLADFFRFSAGAVLVGHNVEFDRSFLDSNAEECGYVFANDYEDTLALSRKLLKGLGNYKLNTVSEYLNVDLTGHHRALNDVMATANIYIKLKKMQEEQG